MKPSIVYLLAFILSASCTGGKKQDTASSAAITVPDTVKNPVTTWYEGEKPFVFNIKNEYPETDIRLSELADVSYTQLGINDDFLIRGLMSCNGKDFRLTKDRIYMLESEFNFYIFDRQGNPVRTFDRRGNGPEEYVYIGSYVADTINQEIFILDGRKKKILVYDTAAVYKREFPSPAHEINELNDSLLICFNQYNPGGARYTVINKKTGNKVKDCSIRFNTKLPEDSWGRLAYGSVIASPNGAFLSNLGNDTVFEINRRLDVYPRIIDTSDYGTNFAQTHPTIETSRYLLFYILRCHSYKPVVKQNFYLYDKKEKQIYKMKDYTDNDFFAIMEDNPFITNWEVTQNYGTAIRLRQANALLESEGHCHGELKEIASKLTGDENPLLIIMNFKNTGIKGQ